MRTLRTSLALGAILTFVIGTSVAQAHINSFSIDRTADLSGGGTVITVSGRISCDLGEQFSINLQVTQGDGQNAEFANGFTNGLCQGGPQLWEAQAQSGTGAWHGGRATVSANVFTFGADGQDQEFHDATVRLR